MGLPQSPDSPATDSATVTVVFRLYVAGGAPNSLEAVANLRSICAEYIPNNHRVEIVDVLQEPRRAMGDGVYVTPTLLKISPAPSQRLVGNLSATEAVVLALGLKEERS